MILHTVNKSPFTGGALKTCQQFLAAGDVVVLLEDGCYGGMANAGFIIPAGVKLYAIAADVTARGLGGMLRDDVTVIDYAGFVALCTEFPLIRTWS